MFTLYTCHGGVMGRRVYKTLSAIKRAIAIARDNRTYDSGSDGYTFLNGAVGLSKFYQEKKKKKNGLAIFLLGKLLQLSD